MHVHYGYNVICFTWFQDNNDNNVSLIISLAVLLVIVVIGVLAVAAVVAAVVLCRRFVISKYITLLAKYTTASCKNINNQTNT